MKSNYIVITIGEGDIYMETLTEDELTERLNDQTYGEEPTFLKPDDKWMNLMESQGGTYIIKGEFVTPKVKEVVTQWEV
jgi:hypothetical protein